MVKESDLVIVGAGPAGLSAALTAANLGLPSLLIDDNPQPGGQLLKQTHKFFGSQELFCGIRGFRIASLLTEAITKTGQVELLLSSSAVGLWASNAKDYPYELAVIREEDLIKVKAKAIICAPGARENFLLFENNDLPGIYGAGAVQTLMNLYGIRPGFRALMVGSGNIGLIVAYQMLQAGISVAAIVEIMPEIGGYHCHAAKIRRLGIPILCSHTIKRAKGKDMVEGAVIVQVDRRLREIKGTERHLRVDMICLAVGLTPLYDLLALAGCRIAYLPELGGFLPYHDEDMATSLPGIFVSGDGASVEEATTAILEGRIAAVSAYEYLRGPISVEGRKIKEDAKRRLAEIRESPFLAKIKIGKAKMLEFREQGMLVPEL